MSRAAAPAPAGAEALKAVVDVLSAGLRVATLEVVAMARKMGLSLASVTDVINLGSGRNHTSRAILRGLVEGKPVTSPLTLARVVDDLNAALSLGMSCGAPLALTQIARGLLQIGIHRLGPDARFDDTIQLVESMAGATITEAAPSCAAAGAAAPLAEPQALKVGYVGLGVMGGALVRRLMLSRPMKVFDVRPEAVDAFATEGALPFRDLASLARECDVIFVCVPTSAHVREVLFGRDGAAGDGDCLARGLAAGKIVVDQTTGDPVVSRKLAARLAPLGVHWVDAPVSGGPRGAVAGTLAIMCGGPAAPFATVKPILEQVSPNVVYCGDAGNGHAGKLVNNAVAACNRMFTYEAAAFGVKAGLTLADMNTAVNGSAAFNGASERVLPVLGAHGQTANFQLQLMVKDLRLASSMGFACGAPMLLANAVRTLYEIAAHELGGTANLDDLARLFEQMADVRFANA
ncbi:MAG: NAD-binding protein [Acidobacteria bacterium]|nr:NAD-binding protein [Acidobacteriota bacterium]